MYTTDIIICCSFTGITLFVVIVAVVGCICENRREIIYTDSVENGGGNNGGNNNSDGDGNSGSNTDSNIDNINIIELQL